jgi:hypothetical protein
MRFTFSIGLIGSIFIGCINNPESDKTYSLSFPLEIGKKWEYESVWKLNDSTIDSSLIYSSITSQEINQSGNSVFEFKDSSNVDSSSWYDYYEKRLDGIYLYASIPGGIHALWKSLVLKPGVQLKNPPVLLVPLSFTVGTEWTYDTLIDSASNKRTALKRVFQGIQKVVTKTGILDCYKFETSGYGNEKRYHYYFPDVGLVMKEEIIDSFAVTSFDSSSSINIKYVKSISRNTLISSN